jgi:hypothetical protein
LEKAVRQTLCRERVYWSRSGEKVLITPAADSKRHIAVSQIAEMLAGLLTFGTTIPLLTMGFM